MKVGSLVECVYPFTKEKACCKELKFPEPGEIYTVSAIRESPEKHVGIQLEEIDNQQYENVEPFFWVERFRELQPPMDLSFIQELQQTIF